MSLIKKFIDQYLSKKLQITVSGKTTSLYIIDWASIVQKHDELMEQTEDMDDEAVGEFLCDHESELMQVTEYFMNDACDEKVEDDKWLPIGLLGLAYTPDSFAELENDGLLLLDMSKGNHNNPSVILFKKEKAQVIATDFNALDIKEID